MALSPLDPDIIFCTGNHGPMSNEVVVSHSSDDGATWEHDIIALGSYGRAVAFDGVDTNRVYVGGDSTSSYPCLLISTDLGATWTQSRTGLNGMVNALMTVPGNGRLVYAGTDSGLFISTDAGTTWEPTALKRPVRTLVCDPVHPAGMFAGTYGGGVYASTDGGETWSEMNDGLTCNRVLSLVLRPGDENTLYAGTEGRSVFKATVASGIGADRPFVGRCSPVAICPNPCRELTTVSLSSSLLSPHASLSVYDASGRLVRSSAVRASPLTLRTSDLSPGTYFIRLSSGRETHTARLSVLN